MNDLELKLGYSGNINEIIDEVVKFYDLGNILSFKYLNEGYEDYNIKLNSDKGVFNLKLFANNQLGDYSKTRREKDVVERLVDILLAAEKQNIRSPQLFRNKNNLIFRGKDNIVGFLYKWIEGDTFYNLGIVPTKQELENVISQIAKFNQIHLKPTYYNDIWALINIQKLYKKVQSFLSAEDKRLLEFVLKAYQKIPFDRLPKCLVHGDLTKGNIIKTSSNEIYIIDFSVSNWTYRIIEIGLIASNFMFDPINKTSLKRRVEEACFLYQKYNNLEDSELSSAYDIALASVSMELLGSRWRQEFLDDKSEETDYWLNLGRQSLEEALEI